MNIDRRRLLAGLGAWMAKPVLPPWETPPLGRSRPPQIVRNGLGCYIEHKAVSERPTQQTLTASGADYIQVAFLWQSAGYTTYDWRFHDAMLKPLLAAGHRLILMVSASPLQRGADGRSWRNLLDPDGALDRAQLLPLKAFLVAAMQRYPGPHIWCWEEEPDTWHDFKQANGRGTGCWGGKHAEFLEVVRVMAEARDVAQSGALVALPPVARENWAPTTARPSFDMDWLAQMAALGAFELVDAWGVNYYAPGFYPFHGQGPHSVIAKLQKARDTLPERYRSRALFVNTGHVSHDQVGIYHQAAADYLWQAMAHLWAAPWLHGLNIIAQTAFLWPGFVDGSGRAFALRATDGTLLPAWHTFLRLVQLMPGKPVGATPHPCGVGYQFTLANGQRVPLTWADCATPSPSKPYPRRLPPDGA